MTQSFGAVVLVDDHGKAEEWLVFDRSDVALVEELTQQEVIFRKVANLDLDGSACCVAYSVTLCKFAVEQSSEDFAGR
jgi:translation initiation factor 6 (eIF-6)